MKKTREKTSKLKMKKFLLRDTRDVEYKFVKMNMAYDNWDAWEPKNPSELMLKNAIDSNEHIGT
jgi:hypothetical protein